MTYLFIYLACAIILAVDAYALSFGYFQGKFPTTAKDAYLDNLWFGIGTGLTTLLIPILWIVVLVSSNGGQYGRKYR